MFCFQYFGGTRSIWLGCTTWSSYSSKGWPDNWWSVLLWSHFGVGQTEKWLQSIV